jgi:predicted HicB family RNase H-like nuclease
MEVITMMTDSIMLRIPKQLHYVLKLEAVRQNKYIYQLIEKMLEREKQEELKSPDFASVEA